MGLYAPLSYTGAMNKCTHNCCAHLECSVSYTQKISNCTATWIERDHFTV